MTEYLIATAVLESIVRGSLAGDDRIRLHAGLPLVRAHAAEVSVEDDSCRVVVHVDARMGESLPDLAMSLRKKVAATLAPMTGLAVTSVDVVFSGVFATGS